jgi:hypothetical protein
VQASSRLKESGSGVIIYISKSLNYLFIYQRLSFKIKQETGLKNKLENTLSVQKEI